MKFRFKNITLPSALCSLQTKDAIPSNKQSRNDKPYGSGLASFQPLSSLISHLSALCPLRYAQTNNSIAETKKTLILKQKNMIDWTLHIESNPEILF